MLTDNRQAERHRIAAPVAIGPWRAQTYDMSTTGVAIDGVPVLEVGTRVDFQIFLEQTGLVIKCTGYVARVDTSIAADNCRVGVCCDEMIFEPAPLQPGIVLSRSGPRSEGDDS